MRIFKSVAIVGIFAAAPAFAQTSAAPGTGLGNTPGTSGTAIQAPNPNLPPTTNQTTPGTPNTGIGGNLTGGIPGTLGGTPYSVGGSVTGGIPGTLGATPSGGASSGSNTSIGGAGISGTPGLPSTIGGSTTGAIGTGSSLGGVPSSSVGAAPIGGATGRIR